MVHKGHQNNQKIIFIVEVQASCTTWFPQGNMLAINCSTAIGEVPSVFETCLNSFPVILLWGWHFLVHKCVPDYLTHLGYNEAYCAWRHLKTTAKGLIRVTRCKKSKIWKREGTDNWLCRLACTILYLALYRFSRLCHVGTLMQCGNQFRPLFGCHMQTKFF